jgi:hypothetical protein
MLLEHPVFDIVREVNRNEVVRYVAKNPNATDEEIMHAIERLAKDQRQGRPGTGLRIWDQGGTDYPVDHYLRIVRYEAFHGIGKLLSRLP